MAVPGCTSHNYPRIQNFKRKIYRTSSDGFREGRRGSLGSGLLSGGLLQFSRGHFQSFNSALAGFSAEYESIPSSHQTGAESNKLHKLRDQGMKISKFIVF